MKKAFALLTVLLLLTACGKTEDAPAPVPAQPETAVTELLCDFAAEDLNGNAVDETVFSGCKVTMVNVWATFCSPCIREMPDLAALNRDLAADGFQIIGIPVDVTDYNMEKIPALITAAEDIIAQTGADYRHLLPSESLNRAFLNEVQVVPTTVFVNEKGEQLGEVYTGARSAEQWSVIIESLLGSAE